jgi:hypothetical protein
MIWRILPLLILDAALIATASDSDGFLPAEAHLFSLAHLPSITKEAALPCAVRLAPSGRAMTLYGGRLVALAEQTEDTLFNWTPPPDAEPIQDFCWLDGHTLALLRETYIDFIRDGKLLRGVILPEKGMRMARADAGHCYLFGGSNRAEHHDVLLFGADGSIKNLFRAPDPITAVTGDGGNTFAAVGPVVFFFSRGSEPRPVFRERMTITDLAYAPPAGVFYLTGEGVGCMDSPGSGLMFLRRDITSLDGRGDRLLLLTKDREVLLIKPVSGFPRLIKDVRPVITEEQEPGGDLHSQGNTPAATAGPEQ